jgi:hypothetical protein
MKAKAKLSAKIGGIQYTVNPGENVPPVIAEFYAANKAIDGLIRSGAIEPDVESKKGK